MNEAGSEKGDEIKRPKNKKHKKEKTSVEQHAKGRSKDKHSKKSKKPKKSKHRKRSTSSSSSSCDVQHKRSRKSKQGKHVSKKKKRSRSSDSNDCLLKREKTSTEAALSSKMLQNVDKNTSSRGEPGMHACLTLYWLFGLSRVVHICVRFISKQSSDVHGLLMPTLNRFGCRSSGARAFSV